jgi:hypothetical protein
VITLGPRTWYEIAEEVNGKIERAVVGRRANEAFKWLAVMDLIDPETSEYWRDTGWPLYTGISWQPEPFTGGLI